MHDVTPGTGTISPRTRMAPDERRRALIRTAFTMIAVKGFEGLRTREVAAAGGINQATLHYYFPDKESLIRAVIAFALDQFLTQARAYAGGKTPRERLRIEFATARETLHTNPELETVLNELVTRAARDMAVRDALREMDDFWHASMATIFVDGMRDGSFRPDLDPATTATLVIGLLRGLRLQAALAPARADFAAALAMIERFIGNDTERNDT